MTIYNKFKDNPNFTMYEVYHWEAHPSQTDDSHQFKEVPGDWWYQQPFTRPQNLTHRILHHECYKKAYPDVTIPGLVDEGADGNNPTVTTGCVVSAKYKAKYTSIYVVGLDSTFKYVSHWPPGPGGTDAGAKIWVDTSYKTLDKILTQIVPTTPIMPVENFSTAPQKFIRIHSDGTVMLIMPEQTRYTIDIFDMTGRRISKNQGLGAERFTICGKIGAGAYIVRLQTDKGAYTAPVVITKKY